MRRSQGNRCGIVPCLAILITILTTPAQAYESEWGDYAKALDAMAKVAGDYEASIKRLAVHQAQVLTKPSLANASAWREKRDKLKRGQIKLESKLKQAKAAHDRTSAKFKAAIKPYTDMAAKAVAIAKAVHAASGHEANKRRALATISRDLIKMNGPLASKVMKLNKTLQDAIKVGRPHEFVASELNKWAKQVPGGEIFVTALTDVLKEVFKETTYTEKLKAYDKHLGYASKIMKAMAILGGGTASPFGNENIDRLANIYDLAVDLVPGEGSLMGLKAYALFQKKMIESIAGSLKQISITIAGKNLQALYLGAYNQSELASQRAWAGLGLNENHLFGRIDFSDPGEWLVRVEPTRSPLRGVKYVVGEDISITFGAPTSQARIAWLLVLPASDKNPGSELAAKYLASGSRGRKGAGTYAFYLMSSCRRIAGDNNLCRVTFRTIKAQAYHARLFKDAKAAKGAQAAQAAFTVEDSKWKVRADKGYVVVKDKIKVHYTAPVVHSISAWVGIVDADIKHGKEKRNDDFDLAFKYVRGTRGTYEFIAPDKPGHYDFRLHDTDFDGKQVDFDGFIVISEPTPMLALEKSEFTPDEPIRVKYKGSFTYDRSAFIGI